MRYKFNNMIKADDELKKEINAYRPLNKHQLSQLKEYFRIGLTYSSNAIEGNSLTEMETKLVIEEGLTVGGKPLKDYYEAIGHSEAYDLLYKLAKNNVITEENILSLHRLFYHLIDIKKAGKFRKEQVFITGTNFLPPPPSKVPILMKKFVNETPNMKKKLHPIEFAAWLHLRLVTIHPFIDGNGRTARLLMNLSLLQSGYVITIIPPVLRADYNEVLKAEQLKHNNRPFINFISSMVYESEKDYLRMLRSLETK